MSPKASGLIVSLLVAALVSLLLGSYIDEQLEKTAIFSELYDGSAWQSARAWHGDDLPTVSDTAQAIEKLALAYDYYLYQGGGENWLAWRVRYDRDFGAIISSTELPDADWRAQLLRVQDRAAMSKWLALLVVIASLLVLWSGRLKPHYYGTPVFYGLVALGTCALYGALSAPFWVFWTSAGVLTYAGVLRLLPLYRLEWSASLRPLLTVFLLILGLIAWRGPLYVDRLLLSSGMLRFLVLLVAFFGYFLHLDRLTRGLSAARLDIEARVMGYLPVVGASWVVMGLLLGFWGDGAGDGLRLLNRELLFMPYGWVDTLAINSPFYMFFIGFGLCIVGGIGYFIQRIAK